MKTSVTMSQYLVLLSMLGIGLTTVILLYYSQAPIWFFLHNASGIGMFLFALPSLWKDMYEHSKYFK